uniref:Uncharacterized protein n=1 Tax=Triticum urartu TaxID=4572 RepID=A0A8R7U9A0_TRIUA
MHRSVPRPPPSPRPANVSSSSGVVLFIVIVPGSRLRSRRNVTIDHLVLYLRPPRRHRRVRHLHCTPGLLELVPETVKIESRRHTPSSTTTPTTLEVPTT